MQRPILSCVLIMGLLSSAMSVLAHGHHHEKVQTQSQRDAANGIFEDKDVLDRQLSDWEGVWQSVEPYLLSGELDEVLQKKAETKKDKTVEEYRAYYTQGYKTDVDMIGIENNIIEFHRGENVDSCEYHYDGYRILHYESGKKGVRYLFRCDDAKSQAPKFIQFSDHIIAPEKAGHFHLYMGNTSQDELLKELSNWPTYYPYSMKADDIVHEMLYH
ncbi:MULTISPECIES: metal-binding protein ZinT [Proteus]|uniref:Metal-binding protein ZinT n=1 Tax=Proteus penneri TaxID=102862 RepID=A0A0G4QEH8_9GAMM|nr:MULTISPECIES: metal-binding protein ZinT [Proteus]MBJ2119085.1 metal-binding protein ZinT [Proteus penneri]MCO8051577.1 metal-binding protein ZinT [Proteus penneri]MCX2588925.1 metal-binding protein ZinT [Proteus penneri]NBL76441.1 metal-binding protein ZinT [Proteus sp. G2672]NBL90514.1 metal-binding protein ZinT [Proteus sp. G2673]